MKPLYKKIAKFALIYIATVGLNVGVHYSNYRRSVFNSQDTLHHGPNLRQTWANVAEIYKEQMTSPKVLIPLEFLATGRPYEPIQIRRMD